MSWSLVPRTLSRVLVVLLVLSGGVLVSPLTVGAADPSPGVPVSNAVPGPAPTCLPETRAQRHPWRRSDHVQLCLPDRDPAELRDQDLVLWDVQPVEALRHLAHHGRGHPDHAFTSVHIFDIRSDPGVFPIDAREFMRVDSDATSDAPGIQEGVSLKAGRYLLGISRGDPVTGRRHRPASTA